MSSADVEQIVKAVNNQAAAITELQRYVNALIAEVVWQRAVILGLLGSIVILLVGLGVIFLVPWFRSHWKS